VIEKNIKVGIKNAGQNISMKYKKMFLFSFIFIFCTFILSAQMITEGSFEIGRIEEKNHIRSAPDSIYKKLINEIRQKEKNLNVQFNSKLVVLINAAETRRTVLDYDNEIAYFFSEIQGEKYYKTDTISSVYNHLISLPMNGLKNYSEIESIDHSRDKGEFTIKELNTGRVIRRVSISKRILIPQKKGLKENLLLETYIQDTIGFRNKYGVKSFSRKINKKLFSTDTLNCLHYKYRPYYINIFEDLSSHNFFDYRKIDINNLEVIDKHDIPNIIYANEYGKFGFQHWSQQKIRDVLASVHILSESVDYVLNVDSTACEDK